MHQQPVLYLDMVLPKMEEQWYTRIKDAFTKLADFIESNKLVVPYDETSVNYLNSVAFLKKSQQQDVKRAVKEVVLGSSTYEGKVYKNVDLMKGLDPDKGGFVIYDSVNKKNLSGPFLKSDFLFRFVSKKIGVEGVELPITCEIRYRTILDNMRKRYTSDKKMCDDFINAWYYSASCLADGFSYFINHYCLEEVSQEHRTQIRNRIPKECFDVKPLGNSLKLENVFKLVQNISSNQYTKSVLSTVGVDASMIDHLVNAAQENIKKIDVESLRNQTLEAVQTGEIDSLGPTLKGLVTTMSHCIPSVDAGDPNEQD